MFPSLQEKLKRFEDLEQQLQDPKFSPTLTGCWNSSVSMVVC